MYYIVGYYHTNATYNPKLGNWIPGRKYKSYWTGSCFGCKYKATKYESYKDACTGTCDLQEFEDTRKYKIDIKEEL